MSGVGFLGELDVIEHLAKQRKHEIYIPLKDKGIDFVSTKNQNFYQIQVKTSMFQKGSYFWFDLYEEKMRYSPNTLYIFVCKVLERRQFMGKSHNFLVIPSLQIKRWAADGKIARKKGARGVFNIFIYPDFKSKKWFYRNKGKKINLTAYWNNFDRLG